LLCAAALIAFPLALMICADPELSRTELRFNQAYWALFQLLGEAGRRQLKEEDVQFLEHAQEECGMPRVGGLSAAAMCLQSCRVTIISTPCSVHRGQSSLAPDRKAPSIPPPRAVRAIQLAGIAPTKLGPTNFQIL
jgi:hypothetical protein